MPQRERDKARRAGVEASGGADSALQLRIKVLESELEQARSQIRELEASRIEAVNRIDWVIDSLHLVAEKYG